MPSAGRIDHGVRQLVGEYRHRVGEAGEGGRRRQPVELRDYRHLPLHQQAALRRRDRPGRLPGAISTARTGRRTFPPIHRARPGGGAAGRARRGRRRCGSAPPAAGRGRRRRPPGTAPSSRAILPLLAGPRTRRSGIGGCFCVEAAGPPRPLNPSADPGRLTREAAPTFVGVMTPRYGETMAPGYDQVADAYQALDESAQAPWPRQERVRMFAAVLAPGSRILDLGCGSGVPATRALATEHRVTGADISAEQIDRARSNVPEATFVHGDVRDLDLPPGTFDAIVALYLVDNVPRDDYPALFARLERWLRPGGRVLARAPEPGEDRRRRTRGWACPCSSTRSHRPVAGAAAGGHRHPGRERGARVAARGRAPDRVRLRSSSEKPG